MVGKALETKENDRRPIVSILKNVPFCFHSGYKLLNGNCLPFWPDILDSCSPIPRVISMVGVGGEPQSGGLNTTLW